jgi:hypothetical protein
MCRDEVLHCMFDIESCSVVVLGPRNRRCSVIHRPTNHLGFLVLDHPLAKEKYDYKCHHYNRTDDLTLKAIQNEFAIYPRQSEQETVKMVSFKNTGHYRNRKALIHNLAIFFSALT